MTLEEKIMYLESLTRKHFVPYQWVDDGLLEYFQMLRRGDNTDFLQNLHTSDELADYSYILRDIHNKPKEERRDTI